MVAKVLGRRDREIVPLNRAALTRVVRSGKISSYGKRHRRQGTFAMPIRRIRLRLTVWTFLITPLVVAPSPVSAQPPAIQKAPVESSDEDTSRALRLAQYLTGAVFTGNFTVDGKTDLSGEEASLPKPESYTVNSCQYDAATGKYVMKVKIQYGSTDGEFPMQLDVLFAGRTPVITLDSVWIPGLGTFSSRVLIHNGRYSGTWQHDEKGGHLFGKITPADDKPSDSEKAQSE